MLKCLQIKRLRSLLNSYFKFELNIGKLTDYKFLAFLWWNHLIIVLLITGYSTGPNLGLQQWTMKGLNTINSWDSDLVRNMGFLSDRITAKCKLQIKWCTLKSWFLLTRGMSRKRKGMLIALLFVNVGIVRSWNTLSCSEVHDWRERER